MQPKNLSYANSVADQQQDFTNYSIGNCQQCLLTQKGMVKNIKCFGIQMEQRKSILKAIIEKQKKENLLSLGKLIDFLEQYKNETNLKIDQLIRNLKEDIEQISEQSGLMDEQIANFNSFKLEELSKYFEAISLENDLSHTKKVILICLSGLQSQTILFDTYQILKNFPSKQLILLPTIGQHTFIVKCSQHNDFDAVAINFNASKENEQLLCRQCLSDSDQNIIMMDEAEKLWRKHYEKMTINFVNQSFQTLKKQNQDLLQFHLKNLQPQNIKLQIIKLFIMINQKLANQHQLSKNYIEQNNVQVKLIKLLKIKLSKQKIFLQNKIIQKIIGSQII